MQYRVLLWGSGAIYNQHLNLIKYMESAGEFVVAGVVASLNSMTRRLDGYTVYGMESIKEIGYDYVMIMSERSQNEIIEEARQRGVPREKLLTYRVLNVPCLDFEQYIRLKESRISIVSNNCWGGFLYRALGMECLSPFKNLFLLDRDYIKLLGDIRGYLKKPLEFLQYEIEPHYKKPYPVMRLGDIMIHFNHAATPEQALGDWNRRVKKVNYDNLFIEMYTEDRDAAEEFALLPQYSRKICFVPFESMAGCVMQLRLDPGQSEFSEAVIKSASSGGVAYKLLDLLDGEMTFRIE